MAGAPINPVPKGMFSDDEIDGLCDWYDQALASGQGFQSEEERKKYFDDMGDPLAHPLFAGSTEDLEGNEMVEAFRCLREEDKSNVELAILYKDEGNEWMKKKVKKDLKEAIIRYTHALSFLDADDKTKESGEEEEEEPTVVQLDEDEEDQKEGATDVIDKNVLRSQILNNRALASMHLKNFGSALGDINMALLIWPENIKAHFRKCKCLLSLTTKRRSELALNAATAGLKVDPHNTDIQKLLAQCEKAITTEKRKAQEAEARQLQLEARWTEAWSIAEQRQVSFGRPGEGWRHPPQLESPLPFYADHEGGDLLGKDQWPIVVLYPQHRQLDVIQGVDPTTMLVMLLAEMFPEPEDEGGTGRPAAAVHWDCNQEYFVSNLVVYIHLSSCAKFKNCEEWLEYNRQAAKRGTAIESENDEDDDFAKVSSSSTNSEGQKEGETATTGATMQLTEVHLGCTIAQILKAKKHVLEGGLMSLMVFPKANQAPSDVYLKRFGGRKKCGLLTPIA